METIEIPAGAAWLAVVTCRLGCPLGLVDRLAWSALLAPYRDGPRSALTVGRDSGLGRDAAEAALRRLEAQGLAVSQEIANHRVHWQAVDPPERFAQWFSVRGGADYRTPLQSRYRFWKFAVPSNKCPLTTAQVAVLWLLVSLSRNRRQQSAAGIAAMLAMSPTTVVKAFERLAELALVQVTRAARGRCRSNIKLLPPLVGFKNWWAVVPKHNLDQEPVAVVAAPESGEPGPAPAPEHTVGMKVNPEPKAAVRSHVDGWRAVLVDAFREVGIHKTHHGELLGLAEQVRRWAYSPVQPSFIHQVAAQHDAERFGTRDPFGLVRHKLRERAATAKDNCEFGPLDEDSVVAAEPSAMVVPTVAKPVSLPSIVTVMPADPPKGILDLLGPPPRPCWHRPDFDSDEDDGD